MSLIDFQAAALPAQIQGQQTQNQQNALNLMQQQRALSALRGIDINDPDSAQRGINALAGLGQIDAANALTNLAFTRGVKSATLPLVQESIDQARQSQKEQAQGQGQPDIEKQGRLLTEANTALGDIMSTQDPAARQQKAQAWKAHFLGENVPEDAIDGVVGDLSDQGLMAHQANVQRELQQFQVTHSPGYQQAAAALNSGMASPPVMGAMEAAGIPTAAGLGLAANITSPLRAAQVGAAYAGPTAFASTAGTRQAEGQFPALNAGEQYVYDQAGNVAGIRNAAGVLQSLEQRQTAAAQGVANVPTPPEGGRVAAAAPGERPPGVEPTAGFLPTATGARGAIAGAAGAAVANVNQAVDFERIGAGAVVRKGNLDNLRQEAGEFTAGPQSPFWAHLGALAAEYKIPGVGPIPKDDPVAAQAAFNKMATTILGQQRAALGLPATDQSTSITQGATPNDTLTAKGIARVSGILEGNEDYLNAGYQAWTTWKNSGHGYETFQQFLPQWNKMFNPRIFQAQYMTPQEAAKVKATIPNYDAQVKAAKRLGYIG